MNETKMRVITESGFKVIVPERQSFRFCENPTYQHLSGLRIKEMDIGWWEVSRNKLILLELKGIEIWREFDRDKDTAFKFLLKSIEKKATDVLLMLAAIWTETEIGKKLKESLPDEVHHYHGEGCLKLIFLLDTPGFRRPLLGPIKDAINRELAGRLRLFGVQRLTIVDFDTANKIGLPITREA